MTFNHFSLFVLTILLLSLGVPEAKAQSLAKRLSQKGYVQLSGLGLRDFVIGDNENTGFYHVQLAVGSKFKDNWGLGIGAGSWGTNDGFYRITRHTVLGPHIRYMSNRWIVHAEMGGLIGYRLEGNGTASSDHLSLSQPFGSPFIRLQYGIRFFRHWLVGLSGSFLPAVKSEGIRWFWSGMGSSIPISQKANIWGGQIFVGVLLENGRKWKH